MEFVDEYEHKEPGVFYFPRSIPTSEAEKRYDHDLEGCVCHSKCEANTCDCIQRSGTAYEYDDVSDLDGYRVYERCRKSPTYECNNNCTCNNLCGNKLVQYGPRKNLEVKMCDDKRKGFGLFTRRSISAGNFICEYAGEIISSDEAKQRFELYKKKAKMNYIHCISEQFGERKQRTYIDPTVYGNIGRYINHSCDPNCQLIVLREDSTMPILGIFAQNYIQEGSELNYDYGESTNDSECSEQKLCYCGFQNCRKYLPLDKNV